MCTPFRTAIAFAVLMSATSLVRAQAADPSGHWEGAVSSPQGELRFEIDLEKTAAGSFVGSVDIPGERIAGLPLRNISVDGAAIEFSARSDQGFRGDIAADGQSVSGTFDVDGNALPFSMARTGTARSRPPLRGAAIPKPFEGEWNAVLPSSGMRVNLQLANGPDGSTAVLTNLDEGGLQIPGTPAIDGSELTIAFPAIGGSYAGSLNPNGTELSGSFRQRDRSAPLIFRR
jgi:hypothetical protein